MNDIEPWAVAIGDFRRCTEKLTVQLDELTSQTRTSSAVLERLILPSPSGHPVKR